MRKTIEVNLNPPYVRFVTFKEGDTESFLSIFVDWDCALCKMKHLKEVGPVRATVVEFPYISLCMHPIRPQLWSLIVETSLLTITCKKLCIHS